MTKKNYKLLVLAPSTGGKTTLVRHMRSLYPNVPVYEIDEEILRENNNMWPDDSHYKDKVLIPRLTERMINLNEAVFFTSYAPDRILIESKKKGFIIIALELTLEELRKRNTARMKMEGYDDSSSWLKLQRDTNIRLIREGIVDYTVNGHRSTAYIADKILGKK